MAVYDFCSFLNENDLLEIRLNTHWDFVDKFIVVEAGETHTGLKKEFKFDHERFKKYADKLVYVNFTSFQEEINKYPGLLDHTATYDRGPNAVTDDWTRAYFQENYVVKVLADLGAKDDDIIFVSCLDEMIRKEVFENCLPAFLDKETQYEQDLRPIFQFYMDLYAYKLNLLHKPWQHYYAAFLTEVGNFSKALPASIRHHSIRTHPIVEDGGWHFTFLDGTDGEMVLEKQRSWAHSRDKRPGEKTKFDNTTKEEALERFFADYPVTKVEITEARYPKYIVDNLDTLQNFIYKD
jgi:beta-1,4-mannosyl-glycoprotein beta-1,4-N-acetylglucosaminyltransferase